MDEQLAKSRTEVVKSARREIRTVAIFVATIWGVFVLDVFLPLKENFGLFPRRLHGLPGIVTMTFLHDDAKHLGGNTIPLIILTSLLVGSKAKSWQIVIMIIGLGGSLLWLFGRSGNHVGASLLIFGLITFLIAAGLLEKRLLSLIVAAIVGLLYGTALIGGVLPRIWSTSNVSWDGHLCGALAGVAIAYLLARDTKSTEATADGNPRRFRVLQ